MGLNLEFMKHTFMLALFGVPVTLKITMVALAIALPMGFFLALTKIYNRKISGAFSTLYVSFVRGTPMVLQVLIIYSLLPSVLNQILKSAGSSVNIFDLDPIMYAYVVFSLNTAAILAEVFRSALQTVNTGQLEAAHSAGLSTFHAFKRILVPQALVVAMPNICNATINLIKGSSLAFLMTVKDITAIAKIEAAYGYNYIEAYLDIFLIYLILCASIQLLFGWLEKKLGVYR
ncbi:MAG: amino acid ABC transporter permease [Sphaerochaeta sp.]|jgi:L-cystine transport system permease protein|nr:amino acid ABC transporter permease [Sphaerochaeta sp.]